MPSKNWISMAVLGRVLQMGALLGHKGTSDGAHAMAGWPKNATKDVYIAKMAW